MTQGVASRMAPRDLIKLRMKYALAGTRALNDNEDGMRS